jgi:hypothetical protein
MTLDIRTPIGLLFTLIGSLLLLYGLTQAPAGTPIDTPVVAAGGGNINAIWGTVLILFGLCMLLLARRHAGRLRRGAG